MKAFLENVYSFRFGLGGLLLGQPAGGPSQAQLDAITQALDNANSLYNQRRYQDAIAAYQTVGNLVYQLLVPGWPIGVSPMPGSLDPKLFLPLLSASAEWLNVIDPNPPDPAVRGRIAPDPAALGPSATLGAQLGVQTAQLASPASRNAAADLVLAQRFASQGNTAAASFFLQRSVATDAAAANALLPVARTATAVRAVAEVPPTAAAARATPAPTPTPIPAPRPAPAPAPTITVETLAAPGLTLKPAPSSDRTVGVFMRGKAAQFQWKGGDGPPVQTIADQYYGARVSAVSLVDLQPVIANPSDMALNLPHIYYYVVPLGLAECYHALGDYPTAESDYLQAAGYQYLNPTIEAPFLWQRLASLYLDWGNTLFKADQAPDALPIYQKVMNPDGSAPTSTLYTLAALKPGADPARTTLQNLAAIIADPTKTTTLGLNPITTGIILDINQQLTKIKAGLDFWGHWHSTVPIWTFDYLQSQAINFAQLAVNAERDMIAYWERADAAQLTRTQLSTGVAQAKADTQAAKMQATATAAEAQAYADGLALANARAANATANANEYANTSAQAIVHQALSTQLSGGDDGNEDQLNNYADQMTSGPYNLSDSRGTLSAAESLSAARLNREYEVDSMKRQAQEFALAATQAQAELNAANARTAAANAAVASAQCRADGAQQMLDTFNDANFTPEVWQRLGQAQSQLYQRYLWMATKIAKLMQQAYNFETDQSLSLIQADYSTGITDGLLGGEALLADIETFTYELITTQTSKPQPIRQTISLANNYPFLFEKQLRKTGTMSFDTRIDDFDSFYPGTYAGRITAVEVAVDGIVPVTGISGTLENSGISAYRLPSSGVTPGNQGLKYRVQPKEALVLSDYAIRNDALAVPDDTRMMKIFQGAGLVSTWTLSLPKGINDIDYGALTDVRITFYYKARFDPTLRDAVLAQLAARPGFTSRQRGIPMRWLYPDAFFEFQNTGTLSLSLSASDFPYNQRSPVLTDIGVQVATDGSVPAAGLKVALGTPAHAATVTATMDANGQFSSATGNAWAPLAAGTALGDYALVMTAADNPALVKNGALVLAPVTNIALLIGYSFTPRA
jgi:Tc toxin complex TcA C-terminal TcB-binding domain